MRFLFGLAALTLAACASPMSATTTTTLAAADAATALAVGQQIAMSVTAPAAAPTDGSDALILMHLTHPDGRVLAFAEANHTPYDVMAQAPGGALAQVMGLFGEESPTLYQARSGEHEGAPFICGAEGPNYLGLYRAADGSVQIVGLNQGFEFETLSDGSQSALPYSPDQVCARLSFNAG